MDKNRPHPLVSVIVVNRNTADLLDTCLAHIRDSALHPPPEVVVVDNGSTDDSVHRAGQAHPDAIIIEAGRNLGFAAANNLAGRKVSGDFLLLVNTDAWLYPDCADKLLDVMRADPRAALVGPQLLNADGSRQTSFEAVPTLATETLNRSLLKRIFPQRFPGKSLELDHPVEVEALIGAVMMIRTEAFERVGGFDEDYFFFFEETDLACRLRDEGFLVIHEPRARAVHLQGGTAKHVEAAARIEFYRSRYLFFRKRYGRWSEILLSAAQCVAVGLRAGVFGFANLVCLGLNSRLRNKFGVNLILLLWHICGCAEGKGLPRD